MDFQKILNALKRFFYRARKFIKKLYKKIRRIVRKYIRMLIRHTKAHDYTILVYSILVLLILIFLVSSLGKVASKKHKKKATTTEITTEDLASQTDILTPEEEAKRKLANECKRIYDNNKDIVFLVSDKKPLTESYDFEHHTLNCGLDVDKRMVDDLKAMLESCNNAGNEYNIISAYRSREEQQSIIDSTIEINVSAGMDEEEAKKKVFESVQPAGCSEHETGLAIDISSENTTVLEEYVANDATNKWLMNNCHNYGFILRYPKDKVDITGISFEPWHFRYVGKEAASFMKVNNLTLEEFFDLVDYSSTY